MKNYYSDKPLVPFKKTPVAMSLIISKIASMNIQRELKRAVYIFVRNESANGDSAFNYNCGGVQADSGRWPAEYDDIINGVVNKNENKTGAARYFCAFGSFDDCLKLISGRMQARGIFVGGYAHKYAKMQIKSSADLAIAYQREWVTGNEHAMPSTAELKNFLSMYNQAKTYFP